MPPAPAAGGGSPLSLPPQHCLAYRPEAASWAQGRGQPPVRAEFWSVTAALAREGLSGTNSATSTTPRPRAAATGTPKGAAGLSRSPLLSSPGPGYWPGHTGPSLAPIAAGALGPRAAAVTPVENKPGRPMGKGAALVIPSAVCSWPTVILFH